MFYLDSFFVNQPAVQLHAHEATEMLSGHGLQKNPMEDEVALTHK